MKVIEDIGFISFLLGYTCNDICSEFEFITFDIDIDLYFFVTYLNNYFRKPKYKQSYFVR